MAKLLLGIWRDSLHVTCGLTACTPGSAPGPTLGNEYGKTLPFNCILESIVATLAQALCCCNKLRQWIDCHATSRCERAHELSEQPSHSARVNAAATREDDWWAFISQLRFASLVATSVRRRRRSLTDLSASSASAFLHPSAGLRQKPWSYG